MAQKKLNLNLSEAKPVVMKNLNSWGFHLVDANTIEYTWNNIIQMTIQGGISIHATDRLEVSLKVNRIPQFAVPDVFRERIDLQSDERLNRFIPLISERIKVDKKTVRDAIYSLVERLERYRKYLASETKVHPLIKERGQYRPSESLQKIVHVRNTSSELDKLISISRVPGLNLQKILYRLAFSRMTKEPIHLVLVGEPMKCSQLLASFSALLPKNEYVYTNALSERELFGQRKDYWNHKILLGQNLANLSERSSLFRFILEGQTMRLAQSRQKEQIVEGPIQLIGFSSTGNHALLDAANVIAFELDEEKFSEEIMELELLRHAGALDEKAQEQARILLQEFQQIDKPTSIENPCLAKIKLSEHFKAQPMALPHLLKISSAMAIANRKWEFSCHVKKSDMIKACEAMKITWSNQAGLSWQVESTYKATKELQQEQEMFTSSEVRTRTGDSPKNTERHLKCLVEKGFLKQVNGDRYNGFKYQIAERKTSTPIDWEILKEQLTKIK